MASGSALVPVAERERFEQDGYLIIRGALTHDEVLYYREALDRAYLSAGAESLVAPGGSLHWLSAVAHCPQVVGLVDHPATFLYVWSLLGWNIHVYHSHLDVHPPLAAPPPVQVRVAPGRRQAEPRGGDRSAAPHVGQARVLAV